MIENRKRKEAWFINHLQIWQILAQLKYFPIYWKDLTVSGLTINFTKTEDEWRDHCIESITAYIFVEWHGQGH